jgi:gas vesicle protein
MKRATNFLSGILLGALVGASLAIIFTPASGRELQDRLRDGYNNLRRELNQAAVDRRSELEAQLASLRNAPERK